MTESASIRIEVREDADVERASRGARTLAHALGFDRADAEAVTLAVSELATNLMRYATSGSIEVQTVADCLEVHSRDSGPGIVDTDAALRDGFSTAGGLGGGLGGVRRLMDEFELSSSPGGTTVVCRKWLRRS
jgi:serine/threonine-protein kinase RsbT